MSVEGKKKATLADTANSNNCHRVELKNAQNTDENNLFQCAVHRYIDENKPDRLVREQMEAWTYTWVHDETTDTTIPEEVKFEPSHCLCGKLSWNGEYMCVTLKTMCYWDGEKEGNLFFSCHASANFIPASSKKDAKKSMKSAEDKVSKKIRSKMIQRLRKDDYISKLLTPSDEGDKDQWLELCEASICFRKSTSCIEPDQLEERVHCSDSTAEAIRRAIFSTADEALDVFDVVCSFPILPCTFHPIPEKTALADRAKLRLLEDAMYDACEKEGDEEIVEELNIDTKRPKR